eukprot:scaffold21269_cov60-Phaeocystis_antarctica.AAC.6
MRLHLERGRLGGAGRRRNQPHLACAVFLGAHRAASGTRGRVQGPIRGRRRVQRHVDRHRKQPDLGHGVEAGVRVHGQLGGAPHQEDAGGDHDDEGGHQERRRLPRRGQHQQHRPGEHRPACHAARRRELEEQEEILALPRVSLDGGAPLGAVDGTKPEGHRDARADEDVQRCAYRLSHNVAARAGDEQQREEHVRRLAVEPAGGPVVRARHRDGHADRGGGGDAAGRCER